MIECATLENPSPQLGSYLMPLVVSNTYAQTPINESILMSDSFKILKITVESHAHMCIYIKSTRSCQMSQILISISMSFSPIGIWLCLYTTMALIRPTPSHTRMVPLLYYTVLRVYPSSLHSLSYASIGSQISASLKSPVTTLLNRYLVVRIQSLTLLWVLNGSSTEETTPPLCSYQAHMLPF